MILHESSARIFWGNNNEQILRSKDCLKGILLIWLYMLYNRFFSVHTGGHVSIVLKEKTWRNSLCKSLSVVMVWRSEPAPFMCQLEKICIKSVQVNKGVEKMVIIYSCGKLHFSDSDCYEIEAELTVDETSVLMQKIWPHKCGLIGQKKHNTWNPFGCNYNRFAFTSPTLNHSSHFHHQYRSCQSLATQALKFNFTNSVFVTASWATPSGPTMRIPTMQVVANGL